jgi:UDP-N-acetylmuramoyl-tripeptide--D-alanyl-D-alanine ligase
MAHIFTKKDLTAILKGLTNGNTPDTKAEGVEFNSKDVKAGQVFFALKGSKNHGHDFVRDAFLNGAALAVVEDNSFLSSADGDKILVVKDSFKALQELAIYLRKQFKGKVIGVAGSVGKTTTKDLIGNVASKLIKCSWSKKSFNNLLGLSYTICNSEPDAKIWALELGMNHEGELAELSNIAAPDLAIITQIAPEHMEFFRDLDHVADAEFEVLSGLKDNGDIILNAEDSVALKALERNKKRWNKPGINLHTFGFKDEATLKTSNFKHIIDDEIKSSFNLRFNSELINVKTSLIGRHNGGNFAGAFLAIKLALPEIKLEELGSAVASIPPSPMRLNQYKLSSGTLIIDDSYNSSPVAVLAAISILKEIKLSGKRRIGLVLGDMYELGEAAAKYHLDLTAAIQELDPAYTVTFGPLANLISEALSYQGKKALRAETIEDIASFVRNNKADVVLFKASRGVGLDRAVKILL